MSTGPDRAGPTAEGAEAKQPNPFLVWIERIVTAALLVFVAVRLGPQLGALLGVGPDDGRVPEYEVSTLKGDLIRSGDLRGKVVVVNFWATWCAPCKLEMPSLQSLHDDRAADGVVVLGLSTDAGGSETVSSFVEERGYTYAIGRATARHRRAFGGLSGTPTTFLIDKSGAVRHRVVGYFAPPAMRVAVNRLLAEDAAGPP